MEGERGGWGGWREGGMEGVTGRLMEGDMVLQMEGWREGARKGGYYE